MKCNMALWDRIVSLMIGAFMLTFAIAGGPIWFYVGVPIIACAAWGWNPLYVYFGFRTLRIREPRQ
ncbi:MAG TPA: DUF2892 domain-containing protein [Pseudobdellovibrionaceae bacterium]|nr:DUF2892 domain-containing protein [Pseudobdellovibrionaceae bacterium]